MSKKFKPKFISRRSFIKGVGSGVVGSYVLVPGLNTITSKIEDESEEEIKGKIALSLKVNGKYVRKFVEPRTTLVEVLRNELNLTGTKIACNQGECGSCTVLLDGKSVYSCHMLALDAEGKEVTTIEGLMKGEKLHPVQKAFIDHDGLQCGFCTPGQIMAAEAILIKNSEPSESEIIEGMSGNICRCSAYPNILKSAIAASKEKV